MKNEISRRQFLTGVGAGLISLSLSGCHIGDSTVNSGSSPEGNTSTSASLAPTITADPKTLFVAEGSDPESLIKNGLKAMGGIEQFVKKGAIVVIKPNFSVLRKPEEAATTNPQLIAEVVKQCISAGAKEVKVIDFPFSSPIALTICGIKEAVEAAGGKAYVINSSDYYEEVEVGGTILTNILYSKDVLEADLFINMPILKHHFLTKVTTGMKNMMGLVWDRGYFHDTDINKAIAELAAYKKPHLIIMDAIKGITTNGPTGPGEIKEWNQVIFGLDPMALDTYAVGLYGLNPSEIDHLVEAAKLGIGEADPQKITIKKV